MTMNTTATLVTKVLVLEDASAHLGTLKAFYEEAGLIGIRPQNGDESTVLSILESNVDLGGIMLYENFGNGMELARKIHRIRPELPIFLRRKSIPNLSGFSESDASIFRCVYTLSDLQPLRITLDHSIFQRVYPTQLVRGISELTRTALESFFHGCKIELETPYLVKDRIIYGEVFTLISIDSNWCRGYMMLQTSEADTRTLLTHLYGAEQPVSFRDINNLMGEATNMVWGSFKNRFASQAHSENSQMRIQVPIVINHGRNYISFGSDDPQLCFKYTLWDENRPEIGTVTIHQRFVFNLGWSPEEFNEDHTVEAMVSSGELELF